MSLHTESKLFKDLKQAIPKADLVRHEDRITLGMPDVSYSYQVHGWIELKQCEWPANLKAIVPFRNFTPHQKKLLKRKDDLCGHTFILAWIEHEYLWFLGRDAYQLGTLTRLQLVQLSVAHTKSLGPWIYRVLTHEYSH